MRIIFSLLLGLARQEDPAGNVRELVERLRSEKIEERDDAAKRLKDLGKSALPELQKAAGSRDPEFAGRARHLLKVIALREELPPGLSRVIPGVVERLAAGGDGAWTSLFLEMHKDQKRELAKELVEPLAATALRGAADDLEKTAVLMYVRTFDYRAAMPEVRKLLNDKNPSVRILAMGAWGEMGGKGAIPDLLKCLSDRDGIVRGQAAFHLTQSGAREAIPSLRKLLADESSSARANAAWALAYFDDQRSGPEISKLLRDSVNDTRIIALKALALLHTREVAPDIAGLLKDPEPGVRQEALDALAGLRAKEAVPLIKDLLKDGEPEVRIRAAWTLADLGAVDQGPEIAKLIREGSLVVRLNAISALGTLKREDLAAELLAPVADPDEAVRATAARALGGSSHDDARRQLIALLKDPHPFVRAKAAEALGESGRIGDGPFLIELLKDDALVREPDFMPFQGRSLFKAVPLAVGGPLLSASLKLETDTPVRTWAAHALCRMKRSEGIESLLAEAERNFLSVELAVLNAIRQPQIWSRLKEKLLPGGTKGSTQAILDSIGKEGGLSVKLGEVDLVPNRLRLSRPACLQEALDGLLGTETTYILESDSLRILPRDEALEFWRSWWQKEKK